ncbi:MAG: PAS domain-containing protein [Desulfobaccales bacterium]
MRHWLSLLAPSLRSRLVHLVLLAVLPSLGLTLYMGLEEHRIQSADLEVNTLRLTRLAAGQLSQAIEGARQLLTGLSQLREIREGDYAASRELFVNLLKQYPFYVNFGMIDDEGNIFCSSQQPEVSVNLEGQAYIQRALRTGDFVISGYQVETSSGKPVINFVYPVKGLVSAVYAALDLSSIKNIDIAAQLPAGAVFLVLDYNGVVLARYPDPEKWIGQLMPAELVVLAGMGEGRDSLVAIHGGELTERLYGITTIRGAPETNIYVSIGMSKEAAFAAIDRVFQRNVAAVALVGILALLAAWIGGDVFILRRLKELVGATKRVASGDLGVRIEPFGDRDELSLLASSFNEMAESLDERTTQVHQAEAKYRTLVEQIPMVTYTAPLDKALGALYISPQIESILGYSPKEWLADPGLWVKLLHPEDRDRVLAESQRDLLGSTGAVFRSEYRILTRNSDVLWLRDEATAVRNGLEEPEFLQGIMFEVTDQKRFEEQLKSSHERMRELAAHIEGVREEERTRIAREIHDELGQALTGIKIDLAWMNKKLQIHDRDIQTDLLLKRITAMNDTIDTTVQVVRKISAELRPGILDGFGLPAAIEWQAAEFQDRTGIQCQLSAIPEDLDLEERPSSAIFRIFQELLTNIVRHANASRVSISLRKRRGTLILEVQDNGRGISENEKFKANAFGLLGVRERVALLGGKSSVKGVQGQGTTVTIRIPLPGRSGAPNHIKS